MKMIRLAVLPLLLPLIVGCSGTKVTTSGSMNQNVQVGLSPNLAGQITQLFQNILGRPPTAQELEAYANELENGQSVQQLRQSLAASEESLQKIAAEVEQAIGTSNPTIVNYFAQELGNGTAWNQLLAML